MVKTKDELLESLKTVIGEDLSDNAITVLEDFSDTFDSLNDPNAVDWEAKFKENDAEWRRKYTERFFNGEADEVEEAPEEEEKENITYDDLFEEKE